jgi:T3SS (YopN, CesT) and YbjN peptide-binding chaperone 1
MGDERNDTAVDVGDVEHAVITVDDDEALLGIVAELFPPLFGFELTPVPEDALAAETEVGTLFVGVLSDFVVSLELRLPGRHRTTTELLSYLNEENAGSAFVTFSTLDEHVWVSGNVDGRPLVPMHLARVLTYMFQAASAVLGELIPEAD